MPTTYVAESLLRTDPALQAEMKSGKLVAWKRDASGRLWYRRGKAGRLSTPPRVVGWIAGMNDREGPK